MEYTLINTDQLIELLTDCTAKGYVKGREEALFSEEGYSKKIDLMRKMGIKCHKTFNKKIEDGEVIITPAGTYKTKTSAQTEAPFNINK